MYDTILWKSKNICESSRKKNIEEILQLFMNPGEAKGFLDIYGPGLPFI